jgi:hypothetical protein
LASTLSDVTYDVGDRVRLSIEVRDLEGSGTPLIDPDTLVFKMKEPDDTVTTYTFGVDAQLVHDGVGEFHVNWDAAQSGVHWGRFAASGNVGAAEELGFKVRSPKVTP